MSQERIYKKFSEYIFENELTQDGDRLIVGVSGGADSLCLLFLLQSFLQRTKLRCTLEAVHVNHGIRAEAADADEEYTLKLCARAGIECKSVRIDVPSEVEKTGESWEEAARRLRYAVFEKTAAGGKGGRPVLATGHHMDDQAETVLHNLFRGSAVKGLCGILPVSQRGELRVIRPLLCLDRSETEEYLREKGIAFRTDETNLSEDYTRNKIRHTLLPLTKEINDRSVEHIAQSAAFLRDTEELLEQLTQAAFEKWVQREGEDYVLSCECFEMEHRVIADRLIRRCIGGRCGRLKDIGNQQHIKPVRELGTEGASGRELMLPYDLVVKKNYDRLVFSLKNKAGDREQADFEGQIRIFERSETGRIPAFPNDSCIKWFDYDKINSHVQWRHRQPGDHIVTAAGRMLLKDFLIKQKVPQRKRDSLVLLTLEDGEVLWVLGDDISRINTRYVTDENTKCILEARIKWLTK